jgi:hypothetical protein
VGVIRPKEASAGLKVDKDKGDSNFLTEERDPTQELRLVVPLKKIKRSASAF